MATDNYIFVSGQVAGLNANLRLFVDALQSVINQGDELKSTMAAANLDGSAALGAQLGLTGANAADNAARAYTLVSSVMADLNDADKNPFISQLLAQFG